VGQHSTAQHSMGQQGTAQHTMTLVSSKGLELRHNTDLHSRNLKSNCRCKLSLPIPVYTAACLCLPSFAQFDMHEQLGHY
jgi:hypothetical protein